MKSSQRSLVLALVLASAPACAAIDTAEPESSSDELREKNEKNEGKADGMDTCPVAAGDFQVEVPAGTGLSYGGRSVAMSLTQDGPVVYGNFVQTGATGGAHTEMIRLARAKGDWTKTTFDSGAGAMGRSLAAASNGCILYSSLGPAPAGIRSTCRGQVPAGMSGLAIVSAGGVDHAIAVARGTLRYTTLDGLVSDVIDDTSFAVGTTALAVDAAGTAHVAYDTVDVVPGMGRGLRRIKYARRGPTGWEIETLTDTDRADVNPPTGSLALSLAPDGSPIVAYHHYATKSLRLAQRPASGSGFTLSTLAAPATSNDSIGAAVALRVDCMGRRHIVYSRFTPRDSEELGLWYARIEGASLRAAERLPPRAPGGNRHKFSGGTAHQLDFQIAPDGHQWLAVSTLGGGPIMVMNR